MCRCNLKNKEAQVACPFKTIGSDKHVKALYEKRIGEIYVEYSSVPFQGYMDDKLVMVVMRDVTDRKRHEQALKNFHNNIEEVLQQKISELKESEKVRVQLSQQVHLLRNKLKIADQTDEMVGNCRQMRELREMVYQVADTDTTILISGESGTGKELVANLVRNHSSRRDKPFLKVNCNAINDNLLESDLFGYEKGAFTGAVSRKKGKFEVVDKGTIFLDEIGDISPKMQSALLRILQNGEIIRVGGNEPVMVDVRVIAATNIDLARAVQDGKFRLDLYYRLNIINIVIPPLRERKEDILDLTSHFIKVYRKAFKKEIDFVPDTIINRLLMHDWPGNIRELENVTQRAVLMAKNNMITEHDLVFDISPTTDSRSNYLHQINDKLATLSLKDVISELERDIIVFSLKKNNGNVHQSAISLQIGKTALYDKMKRHDISVKSLKK
jgi:Nif-specific regulatory protein